MSRRHTAARRRTGFTLVELLTAMTVFSAIFGSILLTLYAMQKTSRRLNDGIAAATQQQRFATQLRVDAHQAQDASLKPADSDNSTTTVLEMTVADNRIVEYQLTEDQIERRVRSGDTVVSREFYAVSPVLETGWLLDNTRSSPLLTVQLNQNAGNGADATPTLIPLSIAAALRISHLPTTTASALPTQ